MVDPRPFIYPWQGTGWPIESFKEPGATIARRQFICTRDECNRLTRVLRDPIQFECGDRVCKECYEIFLLVPVQERLCHACLKTYNDGDRHRYMAAEMEAETAFTSSSFGVMSDTSARTFIDPEKCHPDRAAAKEISRLEVVCLFGCGIDSMSGRSLVIRTLEKHMEECPQRLVPCERCTEAVKHSELQAHLTNDCLLRLVDCPNECGKRGLHGKDVAKHLAECSRKPPICRLCMNSFTGSHHAHLLQDCFASKCPFGCADINPRELTINHLDDERMFARHFVALYDMVMAVRDVLETNRGGAVPGGMSPSQMTAILDRLLQLECRSEKAERQMNGRIDQLTGLTASGLLANAGKAESNKKEIKEFEALFKVLAGDVHILSSMDRTYRQLAEAVNRQHEATTARMDNLEAIGYSRQEQIDKQREALTDYQLTSYSGRLIWGIDRVLAKRSESHIRLSHLSHPFYTETYGYKLCLKIFLNGDGNGKNSHISLYFVLMKGDFDAIVSWPFPHMVTIKLRNLRRTQPDIVRQCRPDPNSSSFVRPVTDMNPATGCSQFVTQEMVFNLENGYVVDETMFVEVIVSNSFETLHDQPISVQESRGDRR